MKTKSYMKHKQSLPLRGNRIFIDTSFFKGLIDQDDAFHTQSVEILEKLQDKSYELISSNYILDETYTLLRTHCELKDAVDFHDGLGSGLLKLSLFRVEIDDEILAWKLFNEPWSKLSFTDCTSFAVMKRLDLKDVATFDQHFARAGFTIFN